MRILFCVYREWARAIAAKLASHLGGHFSDIAETPRELEQRVQEARWDVIVMIGWSWKVPAHICKSQLVIGMHPSDLPEFAGGSPIQNQILAGVRATKATLFKLNEEFDKGEIIDKEPFSLEGHLADVLEEIGRATFALVTRFVANYPNNSYSPQPRVADVVKRLRPEESRLELSVVRGRANNPSDASSGPALNCRQLWDFIRCREDPYPNAYLEDETGRLVIKRVEFEPKS